MAVSKKAARKISVGDVKYRWRATGNDGWISLVVWPHTLAGDKIVCGFGYQQTETPMADIKGGFHLSRQLVVTNRLVRRVLEHALANGYDPRTHSKGQLNLGSADALIDTSDAVRGK